MQPSLRSLFALVALALAACGGEGGGVLVLEVKAGAGVGDVRQIRLSVDGGAAKAVPTAAAASNILPTDVALDLTSRAAGSMTLTVEGLGANGAVVGEARVTIDLTGERTDAVAVLEVRGTTDAGADAGPDAGPADSGPADSGPVDSGPTDAGPTDSGPVDSGPTDAGPTDSGPTDAGPTDSGPADSGPTDAGLTDAGPTDAGPADSGPTDGGAACTPFNCGGTSAVCTAGGCQSVVVTITGPTATFLRGTVTVAASVTGPAPSSVVFSAIRSGNTTPIGTDPSSPYSVSFDTTSIGDGTITLRALATYASTETVDGTRGTTVDNTLPTAIVAPQFPDGGPGAFLRDAPPSSVVVNLTASDLLSGVKEVRMGLDTPGATPLANLGGTYRFSFDPASPAWSDADSDGVMQASVAYSVSDNAGNVRTGATPVNVTRIGWTASFPTAAVVGNVVSTKNAVIAYAGAAVQAFHPANGALLGDTAGGSALLPRALLGFPAADFASVLFSPSGFGSSFVWMMDAIQGSASSCDLTSSSPTIQLGSTVIRNDSRVGIFLAPTQLIFGHSLTALPLTASQTTVCSTPLAVFAPPMRSDSSVLLGNTVFYVGSDGTQLFMVGFTLSQSRWDSVGPSASFASDDASAPLPMAALGDSADERILLVAYYPGAVSGSTSHLRSFKTDGRADRDLEISASTCQELLVGSAVPASTTGERYVYAVCENEVVRVLASPNGLKKDTFFGIVLPGSPKSRSVLGSGGDAGILYVPVGDTLLAYDAKSGAQLWAIDLNEGSLSGRMIVRCGGRLIVTTRSGRVLSIVTDGKGLLDSPWPVALHDNSASSNVLEPIWSAGDPAVCQ